jgi:hypothetical protein
MHQIVHLIKILVCFSLILFITGCNKEYIKRGLTLHSLSITDDAFNELKEAAGIDNFLAFVVVDNKNGQAELFSPSDQKVEEARSSISVKEINSITSISVARVEINNRPCQYISLNGNSHVICELSPNHKTRESTKGKIPLNAAQEIKLKGRNKDNPRQLASVVLIDGITGEPKLLTGQNYGVIKTNPSDFKELKNNTTTYTVIRYKNSPGCGWYNINGREVFGCWKV